MYNDFNQGNKINMYRSTGAFNQGKEPGEFSLSTTSMTLGYFPRKQKGKCNQKNFPAIQCPAY